MTKLEISTPQNVNLEYRIVHLGERILASLIDFLFFFVYLLLLEMISSGLGMAFSDQWTVFGIQQLLLLPVLFYSLYMPLLFEGRTLGKMILQIKVVKEDGSPAGLSDYAIRWLLRIVDIWLFFGSVGISFILLTNKRQRLGDQAAGTVVVSTKHLVKISHTILEEIAEDYEPLFPQVIELTDKDVRLIKDTFHIALRSNDYRVLHTLRQKVESLLNTSSSLYDREYIDRVLRDYNYYTQNM